MSLFKKMGGSIMPFVVVVDDKGVISNKHIGYNLGDEVALEEEIKVLISFNQDLVLLSRIFIFTVLLLGFIYPSISFNYESKYGNGSNVNDLTQDTTAYYYFENLLDVNLNYENINLYSQLEYSNPPIYGKSLTKSNDLPNSYFIEYFNDF